MTESKLEVLKTYALSQGWLLSPSKLIQYGEQITITSASYKVVVDYYPKSSSIVLRGSPSPLKDILQAWVKKPDQAHTSTFSADQQVSTNASQPIANFDVEERLSNPPAAINGPHIGMDESGKGDWFGPVVIAAVFVNEGTNRMLQEIGVRDSKELKTSVIKRLASQIEDIVPSEHRCVSLIEPELYNRLYDNYKNINLLLADAYAQLAQELWRATHSTVIVCDQFAQSSDRLENAFLARQLPSPIQQHHAEAVSTAVAAASILASSSFSEALQKLGETAGMNGPLPKGATAIRNLTAAAQYILNTLGKDSLGQYAKLNFKPIQTLLDHDKKIQIAPPVIVPREGQSLTLQRLSWSIQEYPGRFWRFAFNDGGILDWYAHSIGKLDVRGKPTSRSYLKLREMAQGKIWKPGQSEEETRLKLEKLKSRVYDVFSNEQIQISSVQGVGWQCRDTVLGVRFDFTDGGVLQYYHGNGTLLLQGKPSEITKKAFEALISLHFPGPDELADVLKVFFPDWQLGQTIFSEEDAYSTISSSSWKAVENGLNWLSFWPSQRDMRHAANGKGPCQRALLEDWASILCHNQGKKHLLSHAPTGLGKTISSLVPALAWIAQAPDKRRVYYLVNRTTQHDNPIRELKSALAPIFEDRTGQQLRVVDMVGRSQLCRHPDSRTLMDLCKRSRDHADFSLLPSSTSSWQEVQAHISRWNCPYHTLQGLMASAHIIICDYWWLFSQTAQESGLTDRVGFSLKDSILIVDEAHNLPIRVRKELSINELVDDVKEALHQTPTQIQKPLKAILGEILNSNDATGVLPSALVKHFGDARTLQSALNQLIENTEPTISLSSIPERMLRLLSQPDEAVVIYSGQDTQGRQRLIFSLVDPKPVLREGYSRVYASLSMSGTLAAPSDDSDELRYQVPIFGLPLGETLTRKYASPFPPRNQRWIYCPDTRGTYKERGQYLSKYTDHILAVGRKTPGVTAVFFNSYSFLKDVHASIEKVNADEKDLIFVENGSHLSDTEATIENLTKCEGELKQLVGKHGRAYLFAVYQGRLAEGANFGGNLIKTVVCLSIPLEYPALYHKNLQAIYKQDFAVIAAKEGDDPEKKAREYSLDRLSLSLVLQACGRGIRKEIDRCAFVLLDERYELYAWRRFLEPRPYNLTLPEQTVESFHMDNTSIDRGDWDSALLQACVNGEV